MTRIQFYVGKQGSHIAMVYFLACRLSQKAVDHGFHVYIHCPDSHTSRRMDDLLWTFNDISFLPHNLISGAQPTSPSVTPPIFIGHNVEPHESCDYLINLSPEVPEFFSRFLRMAEILDHSDRSLAKGRERYKFYRDRGYELEYHQL